MADAGCPLATLAAILGHANLRSISKCVHPSEREQHAAMELYQRSAEPIRFWSGAPRKNPGNAGIVREVSGGVSPNENN
jgi:hypothetical protein